MGDYGEKTTRIENSVNTFGWEREESRPVSEDVPQMEAPVSVTSSLK